MCGNRVIIRDAKVLFVVLLKGSTSVVDGIWGVFCVEQRVVELTTACWCWQATDSGPWVGVARCGLLLVDLIVSKCTMLPPARDVCIML